MQKIGLVLTMLACAIMAQAGEYAYLVFTNAQGTKTALSVTDLTMTVNGSQLDVTNAEGSVQFTLTDLASMQFSVDGETLPSGVENVLNADAPVMVYAINGMALGAFDNLVQATQQLGAGAYVISNGKNAQTIVVK
ncbi:MAG: hypothetical protein II551_00480 [Paludibacteraceae bacterium]|nr:hypothetical protein [Paludibacteraceae bacterium]